MSRSAKRLKLESTVDSVHDTTVLDDTAATMMEADVEEDPLASIAAFMAPGTRPIKQPTTHASQSPPSPTGLSNTPSSVAMDDRDVDVDDDDADAVGSTMSGGGADRAASSLHLKKPPVKKESKRNQPKSRSHQSTAASTTALPTPTNDEAGSEVEKTKSRKRKQASVTTQRLGYIAQHGLIHSSLPLLSALTRERILECNLPESAEALQLLYPAFRLDIDTIFKSSIELLEKQEHVHQTNTTNEQMNQNQLTRFYRKMMNLQPKNLVQIVFELAYLFLSHGQLQEAFDHLTTWSQSPIFTHSKDPVFDTANAIKQLHGLLGVIAWEISKLAKDECRQWSERLAQKQAQMGDDAACEEESEIDSIEARRQHQQLLQRSSLTLTQSHAQSTSEILVELRTAQQKMLSFEKIARGKLKLAIKAEVGNVVWLWYYLDCMHQFYLTALPISDDRSSSSLPHLNLDGAAIANAATASAHKSSAHRNRQKLAILRQRLLRKIDEFIAFTPNSPTGFHIKLYYMDLFRIPTNTTSTISQTPFISFSPSERQLVWILSCQLLRLDPCSNLAIQHAWQLWQEQEDNKRTNDQEMELDQSTENSTDDPSHWSIQPVDMIDLFAVRLDYSPQDDWSWLVLAKLCATILHLTDSPIHHWYLTPPTVHHTNDADEIASVRSDHHRPHVSTPLINGMVDPTMSASESESEMVASTPPATPKRKLQFPDEPHTPASSANGEEYERPKLDVAVSHLASGVSRSSSILDGVVGASTLAPQRTDSATSSTVDSQLIGSLASSQVGPLGANELDVRPLSNKLFSHNQLSALQRDAGPNRSTNSDCEREWLGRIEWWIQSIGWWHGIRQIKITQLPHELPSELQAQSYLLRGVCYSLVFQWIGQRFK